MNIEKKSKIFGVKINLVGLEKVLGKSGKLRDKVENKFKRYSGYFLVVGEMMVKTPKLPSLDFEEIEFDCGGFGVYPAVVNGNFTLGNLHGYFKDSSRIDFERKGYFGKIDLNRYFRQGVFDQEFKKYMGGQRILETPKNMSDYSFEIND